MKELKALIINSLTRDGFPRAEAEMQVAESCITIQNDIIIVDWGKGASDTYRVELFEKLVHIN